MIDDKITISIYERVLTIKQLIDILPKVEQDTLQDIANSMESYNSEEEQIDILVTLYNHLTTDKNLARLFSLLNVSGKKAISIINNKSYSKRKKETVEKNTVEKSHSPEPSNYANVTTSSEAYKTNRNKRELTPITDVPSVDFDMPTVPDLPTLS